MDNQEISELVRKDIDSKDAWDAIDELIARKPKAEALSNAMEKVLDSDKARYEHLSWPATLLHILVVACDV